MPSASAAFAVMVVDAGAVPSEPALGAVRETVGGALTVTVTVDDVVVAPRLSFAMALST